MQLRRIVAAAHGMLLLCLISLPAGAANTVFFDPGQVATLVNDGVTRDEITCAGYSFTYTRDKLFTGGGPTIIGRAVRVPWPSGIEAQYVTAGPAPTRAEIVIRRQDGAPFALTSFTAKLLANAGAGRAIEIVPLLNGQEQFNDPFAFDVSGNYGNSFSYDTSPNPWGSTAALTGYDEYRVGLTLDFALTALTLADDSPPLGVEPGLPDGNAHELTLGPNPAYGPVRILSASRGGREHERLFVFAATGACVRSLEFDDAGVVLWNRDDDSGRPVPVGLYFVRREGSRHVSPAQRVIVMR